MIEVTKLDGQKIHINERNIQWIEELPNPAIVFLGGARLLVIDNVDDIKQKIRQETQLQFNRNTMHPDGLSHSYVTEGGH